MYSLPLFSNYSGLPRCRPHRLGGYPCGTPSWVYADQMPATFGPVFMYTYHAILWPVASLSDWHGPAILGCRSYRVTLSLNLWSLNHRPFHVLFSLSALSVRILPASWERTLIRSNSGTEKPICPWESSTPTILSAWKELTFPHAPSICVFSLWSLHLGLLCDVLLWSRLLSGLGFFWVSRLQFYLAFF